MSKRVHVVINPAAGQDEAILNTLNDVFGQAGIQWSVSVTQAYGDAERQAREATDNGADIIAAYGGDGTVMEVANGLIGSDIPLAILPGGTGNVLSTELGIPGDLADAAHLIADKNNRSRKVDMGQCNDRNFLLRAAMGFDAQRINLTSRELRDQYGKLAYFIAALKAVPESRTVRYRFTLDGEEIETEGFTCLIANAGSLGLPGLSLAPDISISDGLLDIFCLRNLDLASLSALAKSVADQPLNPEHLGHWQVQEAAIVSDPPQPVVGDGEDWGETPVTIKVLPGAVRVIVPAQAD
jgi:diacylglycerol kinase (ATP)